MIARFRTLLPFAFSVRQGEDLRPYEYNLEDYLVRVYPPLRSGVDPSDLLPFSPTPLRTILDAMGLNAHQEPTATVKMNDAPTVQADMLQVDFVKGAFDRRKATLNHRDPAMTLAAGDPPISLAFDVVNRFLAIARTVTQGSNIKLLNPSYSPWRLEYLTDNWKPISSDDQVFRLRFGQAASWRAVGVNSQVWDTVKSLHEHYTPSTWETLLLDAEDALPSIGTAIVLAFAALEALIESALDVLVSKSTLSPSLWDWINERRRRPSVEERFDSLLRCLTGHSLKDEPKLWETFQHLRIARNSFLHDGTAVVAGDTVTPRRAKGLVAEAKNIADWTEALLPPEFHRPKLKVEITWYFQKALEPATPKQ